MQELRLKFGEGEQRAIATSRNYLGEIAPETPGPPANGRDTILEAIRSPVGGEPLAVLAHGARSAAILIPGKTRVAATALYVPMLVDELCEAGVPPRGIEVFLATGTHEHHLECDVAGLLGDDTAGRVRARTHDCMDREAMLDLGVTSHGTPILFNRFVCEADVRILTGRILPHYFAGFSGGRKALLPGVAGFDTIVANHRLTLHPRRGLHPQTRPAVLDGNPVHLDMLEATRALGPEFTLNTILDTEHHLIDVVAGDVEQAHLDGCARVDRMFHRRIAAPVDALVTSAGGSPYDCNFMQALKAVMNVANVVRDGGAILWLAECTHGIHPGFLEWAAIARDQDLEAAVRSQYNLRGHNTLMLRELTRRLEIALCSRLRDEDVRQMGFHPVRDLASGLAWLSDQLGDDYTWMSVPNGNVTCASLS